MNGRTNKHHGGDANNKPAVVCHRFVDLSKMSCNLSILVHTLKRLLTMMKMIMLVLMINLALITQTKSMKTRVENTPKKKTPKINGTWNLLRKPVNLSQSEDDLIQLNRCMFMIQLNRMNHAYILWNEVDDLNWDKKDRIWSLVLSNCLAISFVSRYTPTFTEFTFKGHFTL